MLNLNEVLNSLTSQEVVDIVYSLGADRHFEKDDCIIFPTICHNMAAEDASMKLYYYKDTHLFHCYTDCSETFNLFTLIDKVFTLHGRQKVNDRKDKKNKTDYVFFDLVRYITDRSNFIEDFSEITSDKYVSERTRLQRKKREIELPVFSENVLDAFEDFHPAEWLQEGITPEAMDLYNIKYSISRNKIIIPHYNYNHELIGIRGRALNKEEAETYGKYMPIEVEGTWYSHPLSQNLYGIDIAREPIKKTGKVIIFEGEKSCLLLQGYAETNNSVACCGSSINKAQINLLMRLCNPEEVIIAFDKEFENYNSAQAEKYFNKLYDMGKKYSNYANFSFIIDKTGLLQLKDSPVDKGYETFKRLYESRVIVK